ncbi:MAG: tetratricopeptide repeat protein, partial [Hyphomicrobiaceae bacterium]
RGRGFQFVADVQPIREAAGRPVEKRAAPHTRAEQPSMIILPFQTFGDSAELAAIADGLVENLTTILTRVPLLALMSRSSSFALKDRAVSAEDVRRDLGVGYMLEGSIQEQAGQVRANIQLIETKNGFHLWAQQFDRPQGANVISELLHDILPRLEPQLVRAMFNGLGDENGELSSRQLLLRAMGLLSLKGWHRETFREAAELLRQSITLEPGLALTHAYLALILALGHRVGVLQKSEAVVREAVTEAETALELDSMDSNVLGLAGCALADVGQPGRALALLRNAVELNPNNGQAWAALGSAELLNGSMNDAIRSLAHGIAISPKDSRLSVWKSLLSIAYLQSKDLERALVAAEEGCQCDDRTYLPRVLLAAVHLVGGKSGEAETAFSECLRVKPDLTAEEIAGLVGVKLGAKLEALRALG